MPNAVLTRLHDERHEQVQFIDGLLSRVETESRDLVDAERANLTAARERIAAIDAQREPLEAFENLRAVSDESTRLAYSGRASGAPEGHSTDRRPAALATPVAPQYASPGEFVVDLITARGYPGMQVEPNRDAMQRVSAALGRAIDKQTTTETPGVLPKPIIGTVLNDLDGARPFVASIGARSMAGTPGKSFSRPYISQHTMVGEQTAEKTQLPSRALKIDSLDFIKRTYGGVVNISRQDIDWTSPSAWDALLGDLAAVYAAETDDAAAQALDTAVTQSVNVEPGGDLRKWVGALYAAAALATTGGVGGRATALRMPNHIWTSIDMWATLGAAISAATITNSGQPAGATSPTNLTGSILTIPRTVVPGLPEGTVIVGRTDRTEFYEERIGVLSAVEPGILGVEVAYGGYAAYGTLDATAFAKVVETDGGEGGGTLAVQPDSGDPATARASVSGS